MPILSRFRERKEAKKKKKKGNISFFRISQMTTRLVSYREPNFLLSIKNFLRYFWRASGWSAALIGKNRALAIQFGNYEKFWTEARNVRFCRRSDDGLANRISIIV